MKKLISFLPVVSLPGMLFMTSCSKEEDPDEAVVPSIVGTWNVSEHSQDYGHSVYNAAITDSSDGSHKQIAYLYGFSTKVYGTMSGSTFLIPTQLVEGNNVSGRGTLASADRLDLTYYVQSSTAHFDTVTAIFTK